MSSALQQVLDALAAVLAGVDGVAVVTTDPGGVTSYPALAMTIGGQERSDDFHGQTDWVLQVDVGMAVELSDHTGLNAGIATLFAAIGDAVEAAPTLGGKVKDARLTELYPVELIADAARRPLAVSTAVVTIDYAHAVGDYQILA